jgi:hypothetical protein
MSATPALSQQAGGPQGVSLIEVIFPEPVQLSSEHQQRLVSLIAEICDAYEAEHEDRVMWPAGIGDRPSGIWTDNPSFDSSVFQVECCERERFEGERRHKSMTFEQRVIADAIDRMGWPEINAFQDELRKGQSVDEDAGGFWLRAIARLFRLRRRRDPVVTYRDAARAALQQSEAE